MTQNPPLPPSAVPADGTNGLSAIDDALAAGHLDVAGQLAEALVHGHATDPLHRARGNLRLAYVDLARSRVERALDTARSAARQFAIALAQTEEIEALALCARAAAVAGRGLEAVEAGLLANRLAEAAPPGRWSAQAQLALAAAYGWNHGFAQAARVFDSAAPIADRHGGAGAATAVAVERSWITAFGWATRRLGKEEPPRFTHPADLPDPSAVVQAVAPADPLLPGAGASLTASLCQQRGLEAVWSGRLPEAREWAAAGERLLTTAGVAGWLTATHAWLESEIARHDGDFEAAAMYAGRMSAVGAETGHRPVALLGHRIAAELHRLRGRADLALLEWQQQMLVERALLVRQFEGRAAVTADLMALRGKDRQIESLVADKDRFWQWANEDPLTGIGNRRRFQDCLSEWLAQGEDAGEPVCVAMVDVDQFKSINKYSYEVGDMVLKGIADLMRDLARATDLPTRWGGDEFAMLFRNTPLDEAARVAERFQAAVRSHDWSRLAAGLRVSVSVGVAEAHQGDTPETVKKRAADFMLAQKATRAGAPRPPTPLLAAHAAHWLRRARRVVIVACQDAPDDGGRSPLGAHLAHWSEMDRLAHGHVDGLSRDPEGFADFWRRWRDASLDRRPSQVDRAIVALARQLPQATLVTERIDNLLTVAGAPDVFQLHGNAFRWRCSACDTVRPSVEDGHCLACGAAERTIRPDITLLGELPDPRRLAGPELAFKRADVVLVIEGAASISSSQRLLDKARTRGAKLIALGTGSFAGRSIPDLCVDGTPELALAAITDALKAEDTGHGLTDAGLRVLSFLSGCGETGDGRRLDEALSWSDWDLRRHQHIMPWLFPLTTPSQVDPASPVPTGGDFRLLAADETVRAAMRRAFDRMLRFYGFERRADRIDRAPHWREHFIIWARAATHHDLFISRILGSMTLCGLQDEALSWLIALEIAVREYRGDAADAPLGHWRLAVGPVPMAT